MGCFLCSGEIDPVSENRDRRNSDRKKKKLPDQAASEKPKTNVSGTIRRVHSKEDISTDKHHHHHHHHHHSDAKSLDLRDICKDGRSIGKQAQSFTFDELASATENFRADCFLGEGGFGKVYKGHLENINQVVAIKQLDRNGIQGTNEFVVEVTTLSRVDHPNLVKLYGFCDERDQRLLVYEYMPLGSLEAHLHDLPRNKKGLDWNTRMKIAAGAVRGLEYLHVKLKPPIIYRDLKCSNILLGEGYHPKLSDFGLAKDGPSGDRTHVSTRVMGTYGYCAPDYAMTGQLTLKSDIYSFGVVLLELITGRKAYDPTKEPREQYLVAWARPLFRDRNKFSLMVDPKLEGRYPVRGLYQALAVAAMCVQEQPNMRPVISDVVVALNYLSSQNYEPRARSIQISRSPGMTPRTSPGASPSRAALLTTDAK